MSDLLDSFVASYSSGAQGCEMDCDTAQAMADEITALRARLEAVEKERDQWQRKHESQLKVDFDLVDKYRRPKSGNFHFPEDVAHIIRKLDAVEAALATARRDALEEAAAHLISEEMDHAEVYADRIRALTNEPKKGTSS